jgi:transcriptional regulator of acetoin/glycerol metabolism
MNAADPVAESSSEGLRREIAVSWWRSQLWGIDPAVHVTAMPSRPLFDGDERLRQSVQPVLDALTEKLAGLHAAMILADHRAVVVDRRATTAAVMAELDRLAITAGSAFGEGDVGTNAIGTAVEERRLVRVAGAEHYAEILKHLWCYGVPLLHPLTRRLVGVLDLTFPPEEDHPLMPAFMKDAACEIEQVLAEWASLRERAQLDYFLALGRRSRRAVLATMDDAILLNRWAREIHPVDQAALVRAATGVPNREHGAVLELGSGSGGIPMSVRLHTRADDVRFPGVVLEVIPSRVRRQRRRAARTGLTGLVGDSAAWRVFCERVERAAAAGPPLLLAGEAGTGKLAVAQALHRESGRVRLSVLDVASVDADGRSAWIRGLRLGLSDSTSTVVIRHLELADRALGAAVGAEIDRSGPPPARFIGTLDTGGAAPSAPQALLDRFCLRVDVPPLRDRRDDIEGLVRCFVGRHAPGRELRFHPEALAVLRVAEMPGNVQELESVVMGIAALQRSGDVLVGDLPELGRGAPTHLTAVQRAERETIVKALAAAQGNKVAAAVALGLSRATLYRRLLSYGIEPG